MNKMTREEKLERLFEMQDHPERFTDDELQAMLDDEEIREDIIVMRRMRVVRKTPQAPHVGGCGSSPIGEEVTIVGRETGKKHIFSTVVEKLTSPHMGGLEGLSRLAAMFIGCILLAGVAYAAIRIVQERTPMPIAEVQTATTVNDNTAKTVTEGKAETVAQQDSIVTFDNEELVTVLTAMSEYYNIKVVFANEQAKHIRLFLEWNKTQTIAEIVAMLNKYDRINIELANDTLTVK